MKKNFLKKINDKYMSEIWNIGFVYLNKEKILESDNFDVKWLKHNYKDRWFADPFILKIDSQEIVLLAEDYLIASEKGRISKLTIDRNNVKLLSCEVILELESHLSFPAIFRYKNDTYIYPENSSKNNLIIYKYSEKENKIEKSSILVNEPLTDAIITKQNDKYYIFSTKKPFQNKNILNIYSSSNWNGPYSFDHNFIFNDNCARNAGDLFYINEKVYRPAQDCNTGYGKGIVLQEVIFNKNRFTFEELKRYYPSSHKWNLGLHTFNIYDNFIVTDGKKYYTPFLRKLFIRLKNLSFIKKSYKAITKK